MLSINDKPAQRALLGLAEEYEREAASLEVERARVPALAQLSPKAA